MRRTFTAKLIAQGPKGAWTRIDLPFSVEKAFGSRARVSVKGTMNGFAFRTSIFPNGRGKHHMMVNQEMKQGAKATPGDTVRMTLELDLKPKAVEVPADVQRALDRNKPARATFENLAPSHRREHIRHVMEAKKPETRQRRIGKMLEMLAAAPRK